jgi:hypothetical protein
MPVSAQFVHTMNRKHLLCEREAWMIAGRLLKTLGPDPYLLGEGSM